MCVYIYVCINTRAAFPCFDPWASVTHFAAGARKDPSDDDQRHRHKPARSVTSTQCVEDSIGNSDVRVSMKRGPNIDSSTMILIVETPKRGP